MSVSQSQILPHNQSLPNLETEYPPLQKKDTLYYRGLDSSDFPIKKFKQLDTKHKFHINEIEKEHESKVNSLKYEIQIREDNIKELNLEIENLKKEIEEKNNIIKNFDDSISEKKNEYEKMKMIVNM